MTKSLNTILNLDKVYVINMKKDNDKKYAMGKKLHKYNIDASFFTGIDGKSREVYDEYIEKKKSYHNLFIPQTGSLYRSSGSYACLLSHIEVVKDALKNKYDRICILQDDIIFHKNFYDELSKKISYIPYWDVLYLGNCEKYQFSFKHYYVQNINTNGFFAIVLTRKVLNNLLMVMESKTLPADWCLKKIHGEKIVLYPSLIIDDKTTSATNIVMKPQILNFKKRNWNISNYDLSEDNHLYHLINKKSYLVETYYLFATLMLYILKCLKLFNLFIISYSILINIFVSNIFKDYIIS